MTWEISLGILAIINTASVILTKIASNRLPKKALGIFYQYLFCSSLAIIYFLFSERASLNLTILFVVGIGFVNAFGNYFQWRAFDISLSRSVLFFPLMEIWAILLAITFLEEASAWNLRITIGVILCFLAMWLFRFSAKKATEEKEGKKAIENKKWFLFTVGMVLIFGTAAFLLKVFSFTIPRETFLMGWYLGALIGASFILRLEKQKLARMPGKTILIVFILSLAILGALFALYWTYQLGGPVSFVQPLQGIAITIVPVLIGWYFFKEKSRLSKEELLGFFTGIAGAILILLK